MLVIRLESQGSGRDMVVAEDLLPLRLVAEGNLEADPFSDLLEAVDFVDLGVEGAASVFAAAGCSSSAIFFPAIL